MSARSTERSVWRGLTVGLICPSEQRVVGPPSARYGERSLLSLRFEEHSLSSLLFEGCLAHQHGERWVGARYGESSVLTLLFLLGERSVVSLPFFNHGERSASTDQLQS